MMAGKETVVGSAGDATVSVDSNGTVAIEQDGDYVVLNVSDAIRLSVLLDEAIGLVQGGVKLDEDMA